MDNGEQPVVKDFEKCPACGSGDQFFGAIVKQLKEEGKVNPDWNFYLDMKQGVVMEPQQAQLLPIGAEMPGYYFATDICANCGNIYVVKLARASVKKAMAAAPLILPNRADRRRMEREGPPPGYRNPLLS